MVWGMGRSKKKPDPEYEEIEPLKATKLINNISSTMNCDLCGSCQATVRCDKCNNQAFCLACDDMYHRHPKRSSHFRKALDRRVPEGIPRPPLPPKGSDGHPSPPQPPPRKNKKLFFHSQEQLNHAEGGAKVTRTFQRALVNRPLPPTPHSGNKSIVKAESTGNLSLFNSNRNIKAPLNRLAPGSLPRPIQDVNKTQCGPNGAVGTPPGYNQCAKLPPSSAGANKSRKFSLQQFPTSQENKASVIDPHSGDVQWDHRMGAFAQKPRSQSISGAQWGQEVLIRGDPSSEFEVPSQARRETLNAVNDSKQCRGGMGTSASVSNLNSLVQYPYPYCNNMHGSGSFQQLNRMRHDGSMMWMPCHMCQTTSSAYPAAHRDGMKRTTSNTSMNHSSAGSDVSSGYQPWGSHNMHGGYIMPMYPGYYPGYPPYGPPALSMPGSVPGTRHHSPSPSLMSSHRSRKSSKSFNGMTGRGSRNHSRRGSEEREDSGSVSGSEEEVFSKSSIPWQCEYCTFINPGHSSVCGMCSKSVEQRNRRRHSGRRTREINVSHNEESDQRKHSDYDGHKKKKSASHRSFRRGSTKSNNSNLKDKCLAISTSRSGSISISENDDEVTLERELRKLQITSHRKIGDYDGVSISSRSKKYNANGPLRTEGRRFRPVRSARSSTPGLLLQRDSSEYLDTESSSYSNGDERDSSGSSSAEIKILQNKSSQEGTLVASLSSAVNKFKNSLNNEGNELPPKLPQENDKMDYEKAEILIKSKSVGAKDLKELDTEDPSFANTLDDVDTMATNEIADLDQSIHSVEKNDIEEGVFDTKEIDEKIIGDSDNDEFFEKLLFDKNLLNPTENETPSPDVRYEEIDKLAMVIPCLTLKDVPPETTSNDKEASYESLPAKEDTKIISDAIIQPHSTNHDLYEAVRADTISPEERHTEKLSLTPDRQCTPLSFSSSDAQFYSPPDSPEILPNEQREGSQSYVQALDGAVQKKGKEDARRSTGEQIEGPLFQDALAPPEFSLKKSASEEVLSSRFRTTNSDLFNGKSYCESLRKKPATEVQATSTTAQMDENEKYLSVNEIITRRKQRAMKEQGMELVQILREAEEYGYATEDVSIALTLCGETSPLSWLKDNWHHMTDTVVTLTDNYGEERAVNDIGELTQTEAVSALRQHKGNIWAAVTECVQERQRKYNEILSRGKFTREDVLKALNEAEGNADAAFLQLNKTQQLGSFFKKIWTPLEQMVGSSVGGVKALQSRKEALPKKAADGVSEDSVGLYSNVFVPLMQKVGNTLQRAGESVPRMSEDFKKKLSQAILEWESNPSADMNFFDSDDESTIEDLLAVAENPSFYEYFTAVDTDETDNYSEALTSPKIMSPLFNEGMGNEKVNYETKSSGLYANIRLGDKENEETGIEAAEGEFFNDANEEEEVEEVEEEEEELIVLVDDEDLREMEDERRLEDNHEQKEKEENKKMQSVEVPHCTGSTIDKNNHNEEKVRNSSNEVAEVEGRKPSDVQFIRKEEKEDLPKDALEEIQDNSEEEIQEDEHDKVGVGEKGVENVKEKDEETEEEGEEDEEEEEEEAENEEGEEEGENVNEIEGENEEEIDDDSLNVTTGRLSLSFTQTSHQETNIGIKAQTIQTEQLVSPLHSTEEKLYDEKTTDIVKTTDENDCKPSLESPEQTAPVTVQKATFIVGKAIAKAMARESTVKEQITTDEILSTSPEEHSPKHELQDQDSSSEENDDNDGDDDDDDDEFDRSLETIPEEEERSERTESGKNISSPSHNRIRGASGSHVFQDAEPKADVTGTLGVTKVPPAVASFSGPIFIPSKNASKEDVKETTTTFLSKPSPAPIAFSPSGLPVKKQQTSHSDRKDHRQVGPTKNGSSSVHESDGSTTRDKSESQLEPEKQREEERLNELKHKKRKNGELSTDSLRKSPQSELVLEPSDDVAPSSSSKGNIDTHTMKSTSLFAMKNRLRDVKTRSAIDSSGESDEEDRMIDELKMEGRDMDLEKVEELKAQIKMLRQELENDMPVEEEILEEEPFLMPLDKATDSTKEHQTAMASEVMSRKKLKVDEDQENEQLKFDRTVRRLLAEGQAKNYEKAELAAHLLDLSFDESDSIQAAEECSSIYTAVQFLRQDCELCAEKYPMGKMVSMLQCIHRCCYSCAENYFTYQIKAKNIRELRCPFCSEPDLDSCEEIAAEYLNHLDILLKGIVDQETHELFQRKLRDWTLMKDPNFRWCNKCSSGFIANPRARKLICPDCKNITCAQCRSQWEIQHEGIACDAFAKWKEENNPENQAEGVAKHLAECGITCPSCKFTYSLAKGGCMHFTCTECKYEFCSGCGQAFKQGAKCSVGPYCERLGLHAHHPRNCLFYLRDKDPHQLQQLLTDNDVSFDTEPSENWAASGKKFCTVPEQKETFDGLKDDMCGRDVLEGQAGLCRQHYSEYLAKLVVNHRIDPNGCLDSEDLLYVLRRESKPFPRKHSDEERNVYRQRLVKLIKEELPLA